MSPLYGYICDSCNTKREIRLSFKEHSEKNITCNCGNSMIQQVSSPNFRLAGSGWYRDSYNSTFNQKEHESEIRTFDQNREHQEKIERNMLNEM